jgi:hypothetical protein
MEEQRQAEERIKDKAKRLEEIKKAHIKPKVLLWEGKWEELGYKWGATVTRGTK